MEKVASSIFLSTYKMLPWGVEELGLSYSRSWQCRAAVKPGCTTSVSCICLSKSGTWYKAERWNLSNWIFFFEVQIFR